MAHLKSGESLVTETGHRPWDNLTADVGIGHKSGGSLTTQVRIGS